MDKTVGQQIAEEYRSGDIQLDAALAAAIDGAIREERKTLNSVIAAFVIEKGEPRSDGCFVLEIPETSIRRVSKRAHIHVSQEPKRRTHVFAYVPAPD